MELRLNSSFADISIRAKSPTAGIKAEIVAIFILKPEAFRHRVISLISKTATPRWSEFLASSLSHVRHIEANGDLFLSHPQTQNRHLPVQQRAELFVGMHNKASDAVLLCGHNPKLSAFVIRT
jgi:hypothetical protein